MDTPIGPYFEEYLKEAPCGLRFEGLGFRIYGSGFRVPGVGYGVYRVKGFWESRKPQFLTMERRITRLLIKARLCEHVCVYYYIHIQRRKCACRPFHCILIFLHLYTPIPLSLCARAERVGLKLLKLGVWGRVFFGLRGLNPKPQNLNC